MTKQIPNLHMRPIPHPPTYPVTAESSRDHACQHRSSQLPCQPQSKRTSHTVSAGHGFAFYARSGTRFRVVDLHGEQVVDMVAWVTPYPSLPDTGTSTLCACTYPPCTSIHHHKSSLSSAEDLINLPIEHLSMSNTRWRLSGVQPVVGEALYTNASRPALRLTGDTSRTHDMTFMCCHPEMYDELGLQGHRSCASNIAEAVGRLKGAKMSPVQVPDPFNTFQNTPNYSLKALGCSRSGDFVEWECELDCLVAVSSCPFEQDGFNGGKVTDVAVITDIEP